MLVFPSSLGDAAFTLYLSRPSVWELGNQVSQPSIPSTRESKSCKVKNEKWEKINFCSYY